VTMSLQRFPYLCNAISADQVRRFSREGKQTSLPEDIDNVPKSELLPQ
jgi:hypothetical protein